MKISEMVFAIDSCGCLKIPSLILQEMGLGSGDQIRVAYLTEDGQSNIFQEFMLLSDAADDIVFDSGDTVHLPVQLMEQAGIPADSDVQIACLDGCIVIFRDKSFQPEELRAVLEDLQVAGHLVDMLPDEVQQTLSQLEQAIQTIQEGGNRRE